MASIVVKIGYISNGTSLKCISNGGTCDEALKYRVFYWSQKAWLSQTWGFWLILSVPTIFRRLR